MESTNRLLIYKTQRNPRVDILKVEFDNHYLPFIRKQLALIEQKQKVVIVVIVMNNFPAYPQEDEGISNDKICVANTFT